MKRVIFPLVVIAIMFVVYYVPDLFEDNITIVAVNNKLTNAVNHKTSNIFGTGFFIDKKNILTVAHVVEPEYKTNVISYIEILDEEGHWHPAKVVGIDPDLDIAVLNLIGKQDIKPKPACSRHVMLTDILAKETFYSRQHGTPPIDTTPPPPTYLKGEILGLSWDVGAPHNIPYIMHSSALIPGYSGSPLLDINDCYLGMNVAHEITRPKISLAIPLSTIEEVLPRLIKSGKMDMPFLGILFEQTVNRVLISGAIENSPADILNSYHVKIFRDNPKKSMKYIIENETYPTHEIIAVNDMVVKNLNEIWIILRSLPSGSRITILIKDLSGKIEVVDINSGERLTMVRKYIPRIRHSFNPRILIV